jgi:acetyl/propionyl-CoA carboxylase alpha subunit/acetyl-CoA carboxylase carboxyltransferase component
MHLSSLLIANRGEIAIRVARAASELGVRSVAVFSEDDARSLHVRMASEARALRGAGPAAYLDVEQLLALARDAGCDAIHPGYGFLSENAGFARRCAEEGITFVGPSPETLELLGDKVRARELSERCGVPTLSGTPGGTSAVQARAFFASLPPGGSMMIKAVAGGGGRGTRAVLRAEEVEDAWERCRSEALAAFGVGDLYVERRIPRARHVEVQVIGDGSGAVSHLGERECSLQRRCQKLVEIAPSAGLPPPLRTRISDAAVRLAQALRYDNVGTFEFLLDAEDVHDDADFSFLEANPRLQVEHTVTEEVTGIDLVKLQLRLAAGRSLADLGLLQSDVPAPRGYALQARINMETMGADGATRPTGGVLTAFEAPSGPGVRVDSFGYAGYATSPRFDSLLAKLVVHTLSDDFADAVSRAYRALCEFRIEGVETNIPLLQALLQRPEVASNLVHTCFVEDRASELAASGDVVHRRLYFEPAAPDAPAALAGARLDSSDPLAVLHHGRSREVPPASPDPEPQGSAAGSAGVAGPADAVATLAPVQGTVVSVEVSVGDLVHAGQPLLVMEAMKMEHVVGAATSGVVRELAVSRGDTVFEGRPVVFIEESDVEAAGTEAAVEVDLDRVRPDLAEAHERHAAGLDAARPEAVARRRKTGQRTARENVEDLCDPDSFVEYGPLVIAAQRQRRAMDDLIRNTPADGLVAGIGSVNGDLFEPKRARCVLMSYDYTVLAGTQGMQNHRKKDRMFELAEQWRLPLVLFSEGGGGRPGDTDASGVAGLDCMAFHYFGRLSGLVPLVGINSGRCFAGNAALLGCCDVVIATANSNIGMGGPAMIEGGGLGVFRPEDVGPAHVQAGNGVVDVVVEDEARAVAVARRYLSYFQGPLGEWECADQRLLRAIVPENRLRIYDVRSVLETLADTGSVLELRRQFGPGMVTALARIEGRPLGIVANNPTHLAGAIDSDGADKAARFMQLCDAFDLPILFLCDTPGIMVGPEIEKTALVRHASRMFVTGSSLSVPFFTIVLRKSYGLGAQAMAGGSFKAPFFAVSWPTGEFGGMGLEGAVKLGFRNELAAIEDPEKRRTLYEEMVERAYERGKALNTASHFEIDDVIDPLESRRWIVRALHSLPPPAERVGKKRPCIDTW